MKHARIWTLQTPWAWDVCIYEGLTVHRFGWLWVLDFKSDSLAIDVVVAGLTARSAWQRFKDWLV